MTDEGKATRTAGAGADPGVTARDFTTRSERFHIEQFGEAGEHFGTVSLLLLRVGHVLRQDAEREVLRPLGLRWTAFSSLFALVLFDSLEASDLARVAGVSPQAMSLVLANLERDGLIVRERADDRRRLTVSLTHEGRRVGLEAVTGQVGIAEEWLECLEPDERVQLATLLRRVLEGRRHGGADDGVR